MLINPEPVALPSTTELPLRLPLVWVIVPVPLVFSVTAPPLIPAPSAIAPFVPPLASSSTGPDVVIELLVVIAAPPALSVRLRPPEPTVDTPFELKAVESVNVMLPPPL